MAMALRLAERAVGLSDPNPRVGCVLVGANGQCLGAGHTQQAGGAHAEVMALRDAAAQGHEVRGATAYVTLEPCAHHGRTPPCALALVEAGVARVVVALEDPNPLVAGKGLGLLRAAGIAVEIGPLAEAAAELNVGFLQRMRTGRPFVRLKWASSLDGHTAHPNGFSQWITAPPARLDTQAWRRRAGAVLTGVGTALADDPRLTVRDVPIAHQPLRVLLDSQLRLPSTAKLLSPPGELLILHGPGAPGREHLLDQGARLVELPLAADQRLDLQAVLAHLGQLGVNELHVEAGATLNGSWLAQNLVDELLIYLAPRVLGQGLGCAHLPLPTPLTEAQRWRWQEIQPMGEDLRLRLRRPTREN